MEEKKKTAAKPGRKAMTAKEKAAAAKKRAETKALAASMKPAVYVQFQDSEVEVGTLIEAAKAEFKANKKRTAIVDLKLYVKPEEHAAYYVVNGDESLGGKITY